MDTAAIVTIVLCAYVAKFQPKIVRKHARAIAIVALLTSMLLIAQAAGVGNSPLFLFGVAPTILVAMILAMTIAGLLGVLIERFVYRPMLPKPRIVALIASIGLFICLSDLFRILGGPHQIAFDVAAISNPPARLRS